MPGLVYIIYIFLLLYTLIDIDIHIYIYIHYNIYINILYLLPWYPHDTHPIFPHLWGCSLGSPLGGIPLARTMQPVVWSTAAASPMPSRTVVWCWSWGCLGSAAARLVALMVGLVGKGGRIHSELFITPIEWDSYMYTYTYIYIYKYDWSITYITEKWWLVDDFRGFH